MRVLQALFIRPLARLCRIHQRRRPGREILIVEDDVSLGKFLSRALKLKLFSVEVSLDGEAAWETLQNSIYDLVILDLNLPRIDGMELLRRVRQTQPALRMLVLTATESYRRPGVGAGAGSRRLPDQTILVP